MLPRRLAIVLAALATTFVANACAQTAASVPPAATTTLPAPPFDPQLARVRTAIEAAERGQFDAAQATDLV
ncbi:MAG: hypothetical protein ACREPE_03920, partial [Lysobacter sp.]